MPKVTISFSIPKESEELRLAQHGGRFSACLSDIADKLRSVLKYKDPSEETRLLAEELRDLIADCRIETGEA